MPGNDDSCLLWRLTNGRHLLRCTVAPHGAGWIVRLTYRKTDPYRALICASQAAAIDTAELWRTEAVKEGWKAVDE